MDQIFFWKKRNPEEKMGDFRDCYSAHRVHQALNLNTPEKAAGKKLPPQANWRNFARLSHCGGLLQTPIGA